LLCDDRGIDELGGRDAIAGAHEDDERRTTQSDL
jgi:hypothetical protein